MTAKQERFCEEYVVDYNATQAAIRAGFKEKSARSQASELLTKPDILARVRDLQKAVTERLCLSEDRVINMLLEVYDKCIQSVPVTEWDFEKKSFVETGEYQFDSKGALRAIELIGKHMGMFDSKVNVSGAVQAVIVDDIQ